MFDKDLMLVIRLEDSAQEHRGNGEGQEKMSVSPYWSHSNMHSS
jgi:hypothetical protein